MQNSITQMYAVEIQFARCKIIIITAKCLEVQELTNVTWQGICQQKCCRIINGISLRKLNTKSQ